MKYIYWLLFLMCSYIQLYSHDYNYNIYIGLPLSNNIYFEDNKSAVYSSWDIKSRNIESNQIYYMFDLVQEKLIPIKINKSYKINLKDNEKLLYLFSGANIGKCYGSIVEKVYDHPVIIFDTNYLINIIKNHYSVNYLLGKTILNDNSNQFCYLTNYVTKEDGKKYLTSYLVYDNKNYLYFNNEILTNDNINNLLKSIPQLLSIYSINSNLYLLNQTYGYECIWYNLSEIRSNQFQRVVSWGFGP